MKRVLVTGGAGYIGSVLVRKLLKKDYNVTILDRLVFGMDSLNEIADNPNLNIIVGDIRHIEDIFKATKNIDTVIHLAALVGDKACELNEDITVQINLESTRLLLKICELQNVKKVIFASTASVYGFSDKVLGEDSQELKPCSLYAKTKLLSENEILKNNNMITTVLRLSTVHGLSPRMRFDLVVNILTAKACVDKEIKIFGGEQWRPFIHVDDVAMAFIKCLETKDHIIDKQIFNVGSNTQNFQITNVGDKVKELIPGTKILTVKEEIDKRNYRVNFNKISKLLDFNLTKTINDTILEIQQSIENKTIINYKDDKYYNGLYKNYCNPNIYSMLLDQGGLF